MIRWGSGGFGIVIVRSQVAISMCPSIKSIHGFFCNWPSAKGHMRPDGKVDGIKRCAATTPNPGCSAELALPESIECTVVKRVEHISLIKGLCSSVRFGIPTFKQHHIEPTGVELISKCYSGCAAANNTDVTPYDLSLCYAAGINEHRIRNHSLSSCSRVTITGLAGALSNQGQIILKMLAVSHADQHTSDSWLLKHECQCFATLFIRLS